MNGVEHEKSFMTAKPEYVLHVVRFLRGMDMFSGEIIYQNCCKMRSTIKGNNLLP